MLFLVRWSLEVLASQCALTNLRHIDYTTKLMPLAYGSASAHSIGLRIEEGLMGAEMEEESLVSALLDVEAWIKRIVFSHEKPFLG